MEIAKKVYIRGKQAADRVQNLEDIAAKHFPIRKGKGNFSEMVNDAVNRIYNLDPDTGAPLSGNSTGTPRSKKVSHRKR